jgi:type I restriction enzyme S subunit
MPLEVRADHLAMVRATLKEHIPDREVWAFGSRTTGKAKDTSDLDLCVLGEDPLAFEISARLRHAFSESDIPYPVDVVEWATTSESFRELIRRDRVQIQPASAAPCA